MIAYNFDKQFKSLKFQTPYQKVVAIYEKDKDNFKINNIVDYFVGQCV